MKTVTGIINIKGVVNKINCNKFWIIGMLLLSILLFLWQIEMVQGVISFICLDSAKYKSAAEFFDHVREMDKYTPILASYIDGKNVFGNYKFSLISNENYFFLALDLDRYGIFYQQPQSQEIVYKVMTLHEFKEFHLKYTGQTLDSYYKTKYNVTFSHWVYNECITKPAGQEYLKVIWGNKK